MLGNLTMKEIWNNYFDVVILPSKDISDYARELSKGLSRHGTKWTLGKNSFIPHVSLYHIPIRPENFEPLIAEIRRTIDNFVPGYLRTTAVESNLLLLDKPVWIGNLYLKIVRNTVPYFDWEYEFEKTWDLEKFPQRMRRSGARFLKKYGTPMIGANFRPHITLTSFKSPSPNLPIKKARAFKFKPDHLFVCELGPSHSCQRIVEGLPFR